MHYFEKKTFLFLDSNHDSFYGRTGEKCRCQHFAENANYGILFIVFYRCLNYWFFKNNFLENSSCHSQKCNPHPHVENVSFSLGIKKKKHSNFLVIKGLKQASKEIFEWILQNFRIPLLQIHAIFCTFSIKKWYTNHDFSIE